MFRIPAHLDGLSIPHLDEQPAGIRAIVRANRSLHFCRHFTLPFLFADGKPAGPTPRVENPTIFFGSPARNFVDPRPGCLRLPPILADKSAGGFFHARIHYIAFHF
jgi:hypothetical protein